MNAVVDQRSEKMTFFELLKKILFFCIPLMLAGALQSMYNAADLIVVGRFESELALAAVGSTASLTNLVLNLFMGLGAGAGVCVAHAVGARSKLEVIRNLHTAVCLAGIMGVSIGAIGYFLAPQMLHLMGTPDDVMDMAALYVKIIFLGAPASIMYNYCASMLRATGNSKIPLMIVSCTGLLNVLLNVLLVAVIGIGIAGVAIGTIAAQYVSAAVILVYLSKSRGMLRFSLARLKIHKKNLKKILLIGIPSGIQSSFFSLANVTIQSAINSFGSTVVAGSAATVNIEGFNYIAYHAFYDGTLTFVGQSVGAKRHKDIKRIIFASIVAIIILAVPLISLCMLFRAPLLRLYMPDNPAAEIERLKRFVITIPTYFLCGIMEIGTGTMRGLGRSISSAMVSFFGACVLRVMWVYTVFELIRTPETLFYSFPISWFLSAAINFILIAVYVKKDIRILKLRKSRELTDLTETN